MNGFFVRRDEKSGLCREVAVSRGSTVPKNTKHCCITNDGALAPVFDMIPFAMCDFSLTVRQQKSSLIFLKSNAVFFQLSLQGLEIICHCKHDRYLCTIQWACLSAWRPEYPCLEEWDSDFKSSIHPQEGAYVTSRSEHYYSVKLIDWFYSFFVRFTLLSSKPVLCWSGVALGWSQ